MAIEKLYSIKEVAEILKVSEKSVFRYMEQEKPNQLKAGKVGRAWRIKEADLLEFINSRQNN